MICCDLFSTQYPKRRPKSSPCGSYEAIWEFPQAWKHTVSMSANVHRTCGQCDRLAADCTPVRQSPALSDAKENREKKMAAWNPGSETRAVSSSEARTAILLALSNGNIKTNFCTLCVGARIWICSHHSFRVISFFSFVYGVSFRVITFLCFVAFCICYAHLHSL